MSYGLIVEPNSARSSSYEQLLKAENLPAVTVGDGEAALHVVEKAGAPRVVITELSLPRLDGFGLINRLRAVAPSTPTVIISAFREMRNEAVRRRDALGSFAVLSTTSPMSSLARALRQVLVGRELNVRVEKAAVSDVARVRAVEAMGLTALADTTDERLQQLCREAAKVFDVEMALVSFIFETKQCFKAHYGLKGALAEQRSISLDQSFCRHTVEAAESLVVPDAQENPTFAANPLVQSGLVRGYAGVPLITPDGWVFGTLSLLDSEPLRLSGEQLERLRQLSLRVAGELELGANANKQSLLPDSLDIGASALGPIFDSLETGVMLVSTESGRIFYANSAMARLSGVAEKELVRTSTDAFSDSNVFLNRLRTLPKGPFAASEEFEVHKPTRRIIRWVAKPVQLKEQVIHVFLYDDVTATRDWQASQLHLATTDTLTGLSNRRGAEMVLDREIKRVKRTREPLSVCFIDVDHFKSINDTYGHLRGDVVLKSVASALERACRGSDLVARWGGEEFIILLVGADREHSMMVAERMRTSVEKLQIEGVDTVTVTCGVAVWRGEQALDLIAIADGALYEGKRGGRNRVVLAPATSSSPAPARL
jgi:diguanylate cyclase (GGDEF)-like protein